MKRFLSLLLWLAPLCVSARNDGWTIIIRDASGYVPATMANGQLGLVVGREPFGVFAETAMSDNVYFLTGAGGLLQAVLFGFGGLEITDDGIETKFPVSCGISILRQH